MRQRQHVAGGCVRRTVLALILGTALAACGSGGGGFSADGGVSGSGISSVTGNVTEVTGANGDLGGIRVLLQDTDIETVTADDGSFTLTGEFEGPVTVVFELDDGGRAETRVDVPNGGNVDLEDITVDPEQEEARPSRETTTFSGVVEVVDCLAGTLITVVGGDGARQRFTVRLENSFVHDAAGAPIGCSDIRPRDQAIVQGEVLEDGSIGNADIEIRRPEPTATPTARPTPTATADGPGPGRTLGGPRPTSTPRVADRPRPTETARNSDRPRATATPNDADRPRRTVTATPRVGPQPAPTR